MLGNLYWRPEGIVNDKVQGTRAKHYNARIHQNPISGPEWDNVTEAMFTAKLLFHEIPLEINDNS